MTTLPTTPGSVVRATIFGQPNRLVALTSPVDGLPWHPLDESVGETFVGPGDLKNAEVLFDAATRTLPRPHDHERWMVVQDNVNDEPYCGACGQSIPEGYFEVRAI